MRDRLIELFSKLEIICHYDCKINGLKKDCNMCGLEQMTDYLLEKGVVILPCKIGETIYDAREFFNNVDAPDIYEMKSDDICVEKDSKSGEYRFIYDDAYVSYDEIGKTVFLTREEAEQAIKERF